MKPVFGVLVIGLQLLFFFTFLRRADKTTSDFPTYYSVARLWERGDNPYDLNKQCREISKVVQGCAPLAHPPILLPVIAALSNDNFIVSFWRWFAVLFTVLVLCFFPLWRLSGNASGTAQSLIFYPTILSVFFANDTVFVLLAVVTWAWLLKERRSFLAGLALSLSVIKPQLAIILAVPLLFAEWRAFLGFCVGGAALTLLSLALVGPEGFKGIIDITTLMSKGSGYGINQVIMVNTTGVLVRAGLSPFWSWPLYLLAITALCVLWRKHGPSIATVSLSIVAAVIFSPHVHVYDLALLAIPLVMSHRLAPAIASLIMICLIPFNLGYIGTWTLAIPLAIHFAISIPRHAPDAFIFSS